MFANSESPGWPAESDIFRIQQGAFPTKWIIVPAPVGTLAFCRDPNFFVSTCIEVALALALITSVSVVFSKLSSPFTVFTRFGIKSNLR